MAITFLNGGAVTQPAALDEKTHAAANKKGELTDMLADLKTLGVLYTATGNKLPFPPKKAAVSAAESWGENALKFVKSSDLKKLMGALKVASKRAENQIKGKPKPGSTATKALKAIKAAADSEVAEAAEPILLKQVNEITRAMVEADKKTTMAMLGTIYKSFKACAARGHPGLKNAAKALKTWSDDEGKNQAIRNTINSELTNDCRDMTQNLQNIVKALGYDPAATGLPRNAAVTIPKMAKTLIPYANAKASFTEGLDQAKLAMLIKTIAVNAKLYDQVAKEIP